MDGAHVVWLFWFVGQGFHIYAQADAIARAHNEPRAWSVFDVVRKRWFAFLVRLFLTSCAFAVVVRFPGVVPNLPGGVVGFGIAGILGWGADSILGFLPGLKASLPPLNGEHK